MSFAEKVKPLVWVLCIAAVDSACTSLAKKPKEEHFFGTSKWTNENIVTISYAPGDKIDCKMDGLLLEGALDIPNAITKIYSNLEVSADHYLIVLGQPPFQKIDTSNAVADLHLIKGEPDTFMVSGKFVAADDERLYYYLLSVGSLHPAFSGSVSIVPLYPSGLRILE